TVTFGNVSGDETFNADIVKDASFDSGNSALSYSHLKLNGSFTPEQKGFVAFDFVPTLSSQCGITSASQILDARFSVQPSFADPPNLELHRCLMPWGDPASDFCNACSGSVTRSHSTYNSIPWPASGAAASGGSGTTVAEYYPSGAFDVAAITDA